MNKPIAYFRGPVDFRPYVDTESGETKHVAIVQDVDHPRFVGPQPVLYTSEVLLQCEDGQSFETRNTIYKRAV